VCDGKTQTTGGLVVETREQLGGYYLIGAKDLVARPRRGASRIDTLSTR